MIFRLLGDARALELFACCVLIQLAGRVDYGGILKVSKHKLWFSTGPPKGFNVVILVVVVKSQVSNFE